MDDINTYPDTINRVLALMQTAFGDTFKAYYEGDPMDIPKANLPCLIIEKLATKISIDGAPTGHDALFEQIAIRVVYNKLDDNGLSDNYDLTERKIRRLVEARDPVTKNFLPNTLMYVLRTNISLGQSVRNQGVDITYGVLPRTDTLMTSEATVEILVDELVEVKDRV